MKLDLGDLMGGLILRISGFGLDGKLVRDSRDLELNAADRLSFCRILGVKRESENLSLELLPGRAGEDEDVEEDLSCSVMEVLSDTFPDPPPIEPDRLVKKSETA